MEHNNEPSSTGLIYTAVSWILTGASLLAQHASAIPTILSCVVSIMAVRYYYFATKKAKK